MATTIDMQKDRTIKDVQADFNRAYPFLRIDFYKRPDVGAVAKNEKLDGSAPLNTTGRMHDNVLKIYDSMTVGELEEIFRKRFGATVQVSRKSGTLWLETTMTDNWTLKQQNDHGRELSEPVKKAI